MATLFSDKVVVLDVSHKFDKVARVHCALAKDDNALIVDLDVNSELYPLQIHDQLALVLTKSLALDGADDQNVYDQSNQPSLLDQYE